VGKPAGGEMVWRQVPGRITMAGVVKSSYTKPDGSVSIRLECQGWPVTCFVDATKVVRKVVAGQTVTVTGKAIAKGVLALDHDGLQITGMSAGGAYERSTGPGHQLQKVVFAVKSVRVTANTTASGKNTYVVLVTPAGREFVGLIDTPSASALEGAKEVFGYRQKPNFFIEGGR
jgi:hypothetical protein